MCIELRGVNMATKAENGTKKAVCADIVHCTTVTLSERQLCLHDAACLRKQCERMTSDSAEDKLACPVRREMNRLLKISTEM